jgi:hypothetical protein
LIFSNCGEFMLEAVKTIGRETLFAILTGLSLVQKEGVSTPCF